MRKLIYTFIVLCEIVAILFLLPFASDDAAKFYLNLNSEEPYSECVRWNSSQLTSTPVMQEEGLRKGQKFPSFFVELNSQGFRTENHSLNKSEAETRVLFLGDSQTYGWGLNRSERYSEIFASTLENNTGKEIEIINLGIPGTGIGDYYTLYEEIGQQYNPDIVVVSLIGDDDISLGMRPINRRTTNLPFLSRHEEGELLRKAYNKAFNKTERQYTCQEEFRKLQKVSQRNDTELILYRYYPYLDPYFKQKLYSEVHTVNYEWDEENFEENMIYDDGHLNHAANKKIGEKLAGYTEDNILSN